MNTNNHSTPRPLWSRSALFLTFLLFTSVAVKSIYGNKWTVENDSLKVIVSPSTFGITVQDKRNGIAWDSVGPGRTDVEARLNGKGRSFGLAGAEVKKFERVSISGRRGFRVRLGRTADDRIRDIGVWFEYTLAEKESSLRVKILPAAETQEYALGWFRYPRPFAIARSLKAYYVMPYFQGAIVPGNWQREFREGWPLNTAQFTMPWFGAVQGHAGMIALIDTPYDAWFVARNPRGGTPTVGVHWEGAHKYISYPRSVTFEFFTNTNYVKLAKSYRRYAMKVNGRYFSWADKVKKIPQAGTLPGRPAIDITYIMNHDTRTQPPIHVVQRTFDKAAKELQALYDGGWRRVLVHVDGWGQRGYDNLHPDVIPPCPEAGGYEGLARYIAKAKELDYIIELHDNYRDYYLDAPSFSERYTVKSADGKSPRWSYWHGGMQSLLCGQFALKFVMRNMEALAAHHALPGSLYFDVFDAAPLDECFDPAHRTSREQCAKERRLCFDYATSLGMLCASEGGSDWSIPHTTHVNSVAVTKIGIQVPLYSLVYHDATVVYSRFQGGISELNSALHTFAPRVRPFVWGPWQKAVRQLTDLSQQLAGIEMTDHRFLNEGRTFQETKFANGTTIQADFEQLRYRVIGLKGWHSEWRSALTMGFPVRVRVSKFEAVKGKQFRMTFEWEAKGKLPPVTRCFVHFRHPKSRRPGNIVAGLDHTLPLPADTWQIGQRVSDGPYTTAIPNSGPEGEYSVVIGMLCPQGYLLPERLPLYWDSRTPRGNVLLGKLIVKRKEEPPISFQSINDASW